MSDVRFSDRLKSVINFKYTPFIIYMVVMFLVHLQYSPSDDDVTLVETMLKDSVWEEFSSVAYNFNNWSSRVLVNLPIHIMLHFDYRVWLVLEFGMLALMYYSLSFIFVKDNKQENNYILMAMLLLFPFDYATTAGWITTTMTYIWPIAVGLYSMTALRKAYDGHSFRWYEYVIYSIATIYSANQEQMSVFMLVVYGVAILLLLKDKKLSWIAILQGMCVIANLLMHVLVPGNSIRSIDETAKRFPDYADLSLMDKLELGFSSTLYEFFFQHNMMFLAFGGILLVAVWHKTKNMVFRLIGMVPLVAQVVLGWGCHFILERRYNIYVLDNRLEVIGTINESNYFRWQTYYAIVLLFVISICLIASLYIVFGNTGTSIFAIFLLFAGLGGRMVLSFSPTIWASSLRTFTILYVVFFALAVMLSGTIDYRKLGKLKNALFTLLFLIVGSFQIILSTLM